MSNNANASGGSIGLGGVLFIVFLVLKLTGHIDWSWWWVTSPLWIPFAIVLAIVGIGVIITGLVALISGLLK